MALLRMVAFRIEHSDQRPTRAPATPPAPARATSVTKPVGRARADSAAAAAQPENAIEATAGKEDWTALVGQLAVAGAARELARHAELKRSDGRTYELAVPKSKASLADRAYQDKLKAALEAHLGRSIVLKVTVGETNGASVAVRETQQRDAQQADATRAVEQDQFVKELVDMFDGKVVESTIRASSSGHK